MGKTKGKVRIDDKFFDCDQFYSILKNLGKLYASDKQIAAVLNIAPETFSRMKNGKYPSWTEEENRERSGRINQVLTGARENANTLLLDSYFNLATGKATSKTFKYVQERLGHKNISVTMDIYNHLTQNQAELSKRALEDVFK